MLCLLPFAWRAFVPRPSGVLLVLFFTISPSPCTSIRYPDQIFRASFNKRLLTDIPGLSLGLFDISVMVFPGPKYVIPLMLLSCEILPSLKFDETPLTACSVWNSEAQSQRALPRIPRPHHAMWVASAPFRVEKR